MGRRAVPSAVSLSLFLSVTVKSFAWYAKDMHYANNPTIGQSKSSWLREGGREGGNMFLVRGMPDTFVTDREGSDTDNLVLRQ